MQGGQPNQGFQVIDEPLAGLYVLQRRVFADERGVLDRLYAAEDPLLSEAGLTVEHVNLVTMRNTGTLKGMHLQRGHPPEIKLITCVAGSVFDACVDVRPESATYGQWFGMILDGGAAVSILATAGFAHGVQCLSRDSVMIYMHSDRYRPEMEYGIYALDPGVAIDWPLPAKSMSARDEGLPHLCDV